MKIDKESDHFYQEFEWMYQATRLTTRSQVAINQARRHCDEQGWDYRYLPIFVDDHEIEESLYLQDSRQVMEILLRFPGFTVDKE